MTEHADCCHHSTESNRPWYARPLFAVTLVAACLLVVSYFVPALSSFRETFWDYGKIMWWAVLIGFLLGGMMDYYLPQEYISKYLARPHHGTVFAAVGLGFLMSACSHGILALSMELHKKGASGPAVISFLLASPWTSLPITLMLIGFFGAKAFILIGAALLVAIITGLFFQVLDNKGWIEKNRHSVTVDENFSIRTDITRRMKGYKFTPDQITKDIRGITTGIVSLADMVLWWMVLGVLMASLISAFVPTHIFMDYFGATLVGLLMTMLLATVLEVCSEGTAPLAFEIYKNTAAFGNTFAFLMGGVVTDYTEVGLIWLNLGRRTALWMIAVSIPQVLLLGWLFNILL